MVSLSSVSVKYDANKCEIPKDVVLDIVSMINYDVDTVNSSKNAVKVSPTYMKYVKIILPKLEKKYGDKYNVKKNFGGFSFTLSTK